MSYIVKYRNTLMARNDQSEPFATRQLAQDLADTIAAGRHAKDVRVVESSRPAYYLSVEDNRCHAGNLPPSFTDNDHDGLA